MNEEVMYMGRKIPKEGFRAFVYGKDNRRKIAESWDEFIKLLATGEWFSNIEAFEAKEDAIKFSEFVFSEQNDAVIMEEVRRRGRRKASK